MNALFSFFTLRPVFTFEGIRVVWYLYLFHMAVQQYVSIAEVATLMAQRGISWETWLPRLLPLVLGLIAQIALVRLLIEVAATVLLTPKRSGT
jgi:hypothetical protein